MKRAALLLTCVLFAAAASAAEKWWDFYNRGLTAGQSENWGALGDNMQRAISMKPNEELNARARNDIIVYVPHFWLGIAKFNLGDAEGAMREWDLSQSQGVIQKTRYYSDLRAWVSRAQGQKAKNVAKQSAANRKNADAALSKALTAQVEAMSSGADRTDGFRAAQRKLQEAWNHYNKAGSDARSYDQAAAVAGQATQMFSTVTAEAKLRKAARPAAKKPASATASAQPVVQIPRPVPVTEKPAVAAPVVSQILADARVDLQTYRRRLADLEDSAKGATVRKFVDRASDEADDWDVALRGNASDATAQQIVGGVHARTRELENRIADAQLKASAPAGTVTISGKTGKPPQITSAARTALKRAYGDYAKGSVDAAEDALTEIIAKGDGADQAYLLRGCVRYTRGMLRKNGGDIIAQAGDDFRRALTMNSSLGLDPKHFSPKIVAYFKEVQRQQIVKR